MPMMPAEEETIKENQEEEDEIEESNNMNNNEESSVEGNNKNKTVNIFKSARTMQEIFMAGDSKDNCQQNQKLLNMEEFTRLDILQEINMEAYLQHNQEQNKLQNELEQIKLAITKVNSLQQQCMKQSQ
eukprot:TRINITY_DN4150_c0_g1_i1.p6 TRINITY_DN4150_c0_g1~~TRINITY_DN4150_c0_g1_i1.p6  ORF type:complete len:129 (+),score=34.43 TRINITY_DN4150_c0_g1_i1:1023-1409(+)